MNNLWLADCISDSKRSHMILKLNLLKLTESSIKASSDFYSTSTRESKKTKSLSFKCESKKSKAPTFEIQWMTFWIRRDPRDQREREKEREITSSLQESQGDVASASHERWEFRTGSPLLLLLLLLSLILASCPIPKRRGKKKNERVGKLRKRQQRRPESLNFSLFSFHFSLGCWHFLGQEEHVVAYRRSRGEGSEEAFQRTPLAQGLHVASISKLNHICP